jgi:tRNA-2-methylthio-N6-dimethylallyladenosine synthase
MSETKRLYIKTYGCQMNVYDSLKMGDLLKPHGFNLVDNPVDADMVILNTCHIREKASEKTYSELGRIRKEKEVRKGKGDDMIIAVAGCVAQAEGDEIFQRAPFVDIVVGPQSYQNLPKLLEEVKRTRKWAIDLDFPIESKFDKLPEEVGTQGPSAFLSIQEGCDKFCHFCVVPYTRGAEYSRPIHEVYREALRLASIGTKEIILLGQNVSAYHGLNNDNETSSLAKLIKMIAKIDGIERIRYMTSHPRDMIDEELFEVHATEPKLMPFLHLPIQAGSNKILKEMNRQHTREFYFEIINKFKAARPDMAFSSDIIVGYPGESEKDFEDTMDLVKTVGYSQCYSFKYSPRPGTPGAVLDTQIPEEVKTERLDRLQTLLKELQIDFNKQSLGKTMPVLFDRTGKYDGQILGKTPYSQSVYVDANNDLIGQIKNVKITNAGLNALSGIIEQE